MKTHAFAEMPCDLFARLGPSLTTLRVYLQQQPIQLKREGPGLDLMKSVMVLGPYVPITFLLEIKLFQVSYLGFHPVSAPHRGYEIDFHPASPACLTITNRALHL